MSATTAGQRPKVVRQRATGGVHLGEEASREAKRLAAAILEVLAGQWTPTQAAKALSVSLPRYYQLEASGLRGLLRACEPKPRGRQSSPATELAALRKQNERLQRDLTRHQSLVRLAQRTMGLTAPVAGKAPGAKRHRRPVSRALTVATRLRQDSAAAATTLDDHDRSSAPA